MFPLKSFAMTPLIQQYFAIKRKYPDAVLLFRVGDFYETFNEDAETVSHYLGVTLKGNQTDDTIKASASLVHFALDKALHVLVKAGFKLAICEELEGRKAGPMQRGVTDVKTPEPPPKQYRFDF